jgi:(p)ppGpp synthase/HD superfamily hydrolase
VYEPEEIEEYLFLHKAIVFAAKKHDGQKRKGTDIPYISHPMEVMAILIANGCSDTVIAAGILHDTLEDTETTGDEIRDLFGADVLKIVESESEDKSKSWKERKQATIDELRTASLDTKMVCCADKLSNARSMYADLLECGDTLWDRFNAGKDDLKWYYRSIVMALGSLCGHAMYRELIDVVERIFRKK